jgi:hypothetical protein
MAIEGGRARPTPPLAYRTGLPYRGRAGDVHSESPPPRPEIKVSDRALARRLPALIVDGGERDHRSLSNWLIVAAERSLMKRNLP